MKQFRWNEEKNSFLKEERSVSFEDVVNAINNGDLLDVIEHYNKNKYPNQLIFIVKLKNYALYYSFCRE